MLANGDAEIVSMEIEVTLYDGHKAAVRFDPWDAAKGFLCPKAVVIDGHRIWIDDVVRDIGSQIIAESRRRVDNVRTADQYLSHKKEIQALKDTIAGLQQQLALEKETEPVTTTNGEAK